MRALILSALVAATAVAQPAPQAKPPPRPAATAEAAPLSDLVRKLLRRRMERHGRDLGMLAQAVVLLQLDVVQELAQGVAKEPRITRPTPDATDELNTQLPERFFVLQDELRDRAKQLATAAQARDPNGTVTTYGAMLQTCVTCHTTFLRGPLP